MCLPLLCPLQNPQPHNLQVLSREEPYQGLDPTVVLDALITQDPATPYRPPLPQDSPELLLQVMQDCWASDPGRRPTFEGLKRRLEPIDPRCKGLPLCAGQGQRWGEGGAQGHGIGRETGVQTGGKRKKGEAGAGTVGGRNTAKLVLMRSPTTIPTSTHPRSHVRVMALRVS